MRRISIVVVVVTATIEYRLHHDEHPHHNVIEEKEECRVHRVQSVLRFTQVLEEGIAGQRQLEDDGCGAERQEAEKRYCNGSCQFQTMDQFSEHFTLTEILKLLLSVIAY